MRERISKSDYIKKVCKGKKKPKNKEHRKQIVTNLEKYYRPSVIIPGIKKK